MTEMPLTKKTVQVMGRTMAYHERGEGAPILFLHGNPTSSYLWRNVIPEVEGLGRLIAPDLIGMGESEKLPNPGPKTYSFETHRYFLSALIDAVVGTEEKIIFVVHDWGSVLAFDWANHHRDRVRGFAYMEAFVRSMVDWSEFNPERAPLFQSFRSERGEQLILDENMFVEKALPSSILRRLSDAEMTEYRRPFLQREDRWPTLTWPRQLPIAGEPPSVVAIVNDYAPWMASNLFPKLFVNAEPGRFLKGPLRDFCRTWKNQSEVTVPGIHFIQEDSGPAIGRAIAAWISKGEF
jgi:haloalkane dehalogenase